MVAKRSDIARVLLGWYDANARVLPWRARPGESADPYRVWLSEVMLQQTTVAAVRPRFERWVARWPSVAALAAADEAEVMAAWAGLGYYARARNLVRAARLVADRGGFPRDEAGLRELPGLGAYTAAAIAAIAFGARAVVVDANVERVVARLFAIREKGSAVRAAADAITPDVRAGDFAQAMMDLGSAICTPRAPRCLLCPLRDECTGYASGAPEAFPARKTKAEKPQRYGTIFWLERLQTTDTAPTLTNSNRAPAKAGALATSVERATQGSCFRRSTPLPAKGGIGQRVFENPEVLLVRRPARGLLGGMRALPTGPWTDSPPGLTDAPTATDWHLLNTTITHTFTHFRLELALAVGKAEAQSAAGDGEYWPVDRLDEAGLPTVFAKAADAIRRVG